MIKRLVDVSLENRMLVFALGILLLVVAVGVVAVSRIKGGTHAKH